ncbi:hypothetical protein Cantr_10034 [Candida viswanathii]|uniref:Uncharacterized protein n=1 Tax=Candida viswanathii TaxID=5486 RepID=A0A367YCZ8_9ASCO|nr:hypothetical protein Cantr_10034 [Candida viswanathii]
MNVLRRFQSTSTRAALQKSIETLTLRVKDEQARNSGALLKCIDLLIDKHQPVLLEKLDINPNTADPFRVQQEIWDKLRAMKPGPEDPNIELRENLMKDNQVLPTKEYRDFVRALYPLNSSTPKRRIFDSEVKYFDFVSNSKKFLNVDYEELYKRYQALPFPAPRHMTHEDLQELISKFVLRRKHYANLNIIEGCIIKDQNDKAVRVINSKIEQRDAYNEQCSWIMKDIKQSNFPVSRKEQIRLIYLSYFKDRQDVIKFVEDRAGELNYPEFTWNEYQEILARLGERDDILGILLFLATRHDKFDVIEDILWRVGLGGLMGVQNNKTSIKLGHISFSHLVVYFTHYIERPGYATFLANTINYITENVPVMSVDTINTVMSSLIDLGYIKQAQELFEMAFFQDLAVEYDVENSESLLYRGSTSEDISVLGDWLTVYGNLKEITQDEEIIYKLEPTETSFVGFIDGYCNLSEYKQVKQMVHIMDNIAKQPLSTRVYTRIFAGFLKRKGFRGWTLDEYIAVLTRLIADIDAKEAPAGYFKKLVNEGSVKVFDTEKLLAQRQTALAYERLNLLRLSDVLMETIIRALEVLLNEVTGNNDKYSEAFERLRAVREKRNTMLEAQKRDAQSPYFADRLAYVNRAVLFEVFSIVSQL